MQENTVDAAVSTLQQANRAQEGQASISADVQNPNTLNVGDRKFKRNVFLREEGTGVGIDKRGRATDERDNGEVILKEKLGKEYSKFLKDYITNLTSIPADQLRTILAAENHRHDKELLRLLSNAETDENSQVRYREVDTDKIEKFLNSEQGWIIATQLLEHQIDYQMFGLGLDAQQLPSGQRSMLPDNRHIQIGVDQGVGNQWLNDMVMPFLDEPITTAGRGIRNGARIRVPRVGRIFNLPPRGTVTRGNLLSLFTAGATGTAMAVGAVNPALGAGAVAAETIVGAVGWGLHRFLREGVTLDLHQSAATLRSLQSNPAEAAYLKAVAGIDVNDYRATLSPAGDQISIARQSTETSRDVNGQIIPELLGKMYTRSKFYRSIGVPPENIDAIPEQFIYSGLTHNEAEKMGARWQERIQELYRPNDAATLAMDVEQRLTHFRQARVTVMMESLQDYASRERTKKGRKEAVSTSEAAWTQGMIEALEVKEKGAGVDNKTLTTRKELLDKVNQLVEGERGEDGQVTSKKEKDHFEEHLKKIATLQEDRRLFEENFFAALGHYPNAAEIQNTIDTLELPLTDSADPLSIVARERANSLAITAAYQGLVDAYLAPPAAPPGGAPRRGGGGNKTLTTELAAQYKTIAEQGVLGTTTQLKRERERIETRVKELNELKKKISDAEGDLTETNSETRITQAEIQKYPTDFNQIFRDIREGLPPAPPPPGGVFPPTLEETRDELASLSFDQVMQRMNDLYTASDGAPRRLGWPATRNNNGEFRLRVIHAMAEARATQEPTFIRLEHEENGVMTLPATAGGGRLHEIVNPQGFGVSELQLLRLTNSELIGMFGRIAARPRGGLAALGAVPTEAEINAARESAIQRLTARNTALEAVITANRQRFIETEDALNADAGTRDKESTRITKEMIKRQGEIYARATDVSFDVSEFFNIDTLTAADTTYTQAERDATYAPAGGGAAENVPRGYFELMNVLFDYQRTGDRQKRFQQIVKILPPARLAAILDESIMAPILGGAASVGEDVDLVFAGIANELAENRLSSLEIQQALRDIINTVGMEALATA